MRLLLISFLWATLAWGQHSSNDDVVSAFVNYQDYVHEVRLEKLRAGIHDPGNNNDYYFKITAKAQPVPEKKSIDGIAQVGKSDDDKSKANQAALPANVNMELGKFGEISIKSLAVWLPSKESTIDNFVKVEGDELRELVSIAMRTYGIPEANVKLWIEITMFEKNSYFGLIGEDTNIHTFSYNPLKPDLKGLRYSDPQGTEVMFNLRYKKLELAGEQ